MDLSSLLNNIKQVIYDNPNTPHQPGNDPGGLISDIEGLFDRFNQPADDRSVLPASEDPYGDPADVGFGNARPASEDPYGDPTDDEFGNARPASEDPYGDPADVGIGNVRPASEDPYGDPGR